MKLNGLILVLAATMVAANAQTPTKPAAPATTAAKPATTAKKAATSASPLVASTIKAPANIPQYKGLQKTVFTVALRYQEIKIGTGPVAETGKLYKVFYTGWRAADGVKFDSSADHPRPPLRDKDGKPVLGEDGKPKLSDPQPMPFVQGVGGTIPGFDQGFVGMKVGGKRRIFIPWQLAYGTRSIPDHGPDHPGIPAKSDLIFDVELVDVTEVPAMPNHPGMGGAMPGRPMPNMNAPHPTPNGAPGQPGSTAAPSTAPAPGTAPTPAAPSTAPAPSSATPATTTPKPN